MISHVSSCLLAHEEKGLISNTFCHAKREYSFSVRPIGCTPAFFIMLYGSILLNTVQKILQCSGDAKPRVPAMWYQIFRPKSKALTH